MASVIAACVIAIVSVGLAGDPGLGGPAGAGSSATDAAPSSSRSPSAGSSPRSSAVATPTPSRAASPTPNATPTSTSTPTPSPVGTALAVLEALPIKGRAPKTGYDREGDFGHAWKDIDRNGCDTRNDVLARDLIAIAKAGPCKVMTGTLVSPYTGATIEFVRGQDTSALVQIDHLVALSNAWQTGAQQLTQVQREALANDPLNLLAVDGRSNMQKGDGDAATWLPAQKSVRCSYVARQVSVKSAYGLWVTQAEHDAIERILTTCPEQRAYAAEAPAR
ncbi:HNH endonuclease family protein [Leifsonia sp. Root1293]|uniref:HNH endonuclease family protein n=1 Tax=Leifsonia sp. Root1293 TaxID=1736446 RepID=UPI001F34AE93|nr:HNH endonuclease family protein [Leifsonia sp. Root1293]